MPSISKLLSESIRTPLYRDREISLEDSKYKAKILDDPFFQKIPGYKHGSFVSNSKLVRINTGCKHRFSSNDLIFIVEGEIKDETNQLTASSGFIYLQSSLLFSANKSSILVVLSKESLDLIDNIFIGQESIYFQKLFRNAFPSFHEILDEPVILNVLSKFIEFRELKKSRISTIDGRISLTSLTSEQPKIIFTCKGEALLMKNNRPVSMLVPGVAVNSVSDKYDHIKLYSDEVTLVLLRIDAFEILKKSPLNLFWLEMSKMVNENIQRMGDIWTGYAKEVDFFNKQQHYLELMQIEVIKQGIKFHEIPMIDLTMCIDSIEELNNLIR
jgi:hypothetical protein